MAAELQTSATTGSSVYCIIRNALALLANNVSEAFETWNPTDYSDYEVQLTEQGNSGFFVANIPAWIPAGSYALEFFGGGGTDSDTFIGGGQYNYGGAGPVTPIGAALTSVAYVKDFGGIAISNYDSYLQNRIYAISQAISSYCRRTFTQQTYTEVLDGPGSTELMLGHSPVQSITSLTTNINSNFPTPILPANIIVNPNTGILSINPSSTQWQWFNYQPQSIQVVYQAGYVTIPLDIQDICAEAVMLLYYKMTGNQDITLVSEQIGDYSRTSRADIQKLLSDDMKSTLNRYREEIC
jgi:hypothetical protein